MKIKRNQIHSAVEKGIISREQGGKLWDFLALESQTETSFTGSTVSYYFGTLIIISAMTWMATEAFSTYHAAGLIVIASLYFVFFTLAGTMLIKKERTYIPGGLLTTVAVFMTPLLVFALQKHFDIWVFENPGNYRDFYVWIKSGWFFMELITITVSVLFIIVYKFPFLTFPLSFTLWFLSMDITPIIFNMEQFTWDQRRTVSIIFGILMVICAFLIDRKTKRDFSFWLYLFGLIALWSSLSLSGSDSELAKFGYCLINVVLIIISVLLRRRAFIVFGAMGVFVYISHLSHNVFSDSILFPISLSLFGLLIIGAGIQYNKHRSMIEKRIISFFPDQFLKLLPPDRE